jgi:hypothetical protein
MIKMTIFLSGNPLNEISEYRGCTGDKLGKDESFGSGRPNLGLSLSGAGKLEYQPFAQTKLPLEPWPAQLI